MSGINRVGQRVVCIAAGWYSLCSQVTKFPEKDKEYTVDGFGEISGLPGIFLREIPTTTCVCFGNVLLPWVITAFRPVIEDEGKTDISAFKEILDKTTVKVPERV